MGGACCHITWGKLQYLPLHSLMQAFQQNMKVKAIMTKKTTIESAQNIKSK